jgi:two-component system response regulator YesN
MPCSVDCAGVHRYGTYQAERFGGVYIYFCPRNLTHWAVPIRVDGITVASMIGGPVLMIDPDDYLQEDILAPYAVPPENVKALRIACREIPYVNTTRVRSLAEILRFSAGTLSLGLGRSRPAQRPASAFATAGGPDLPSDADPASAKSRAGAVYPLEKERELLASIAKGDLDESRRNLNEILGFIFFQGGSDLNSIKLRVEELVVLLSRAAVEGGASIEEIIGLNNDYLIRIRNSGSVYDLSAFLSIILARFVDCVFTLTSIKHADLIRKSIQFINAECSTDISLDRVAEHVHLSPSHFSRIFREATGENFVAYLTRVRMEKGKAMLQAGTQPLAEIGVSIGFRDQSYFSRVFKRSTGMSPGKYRSTHCLRSAGERVDESDIEIHEEGNFHGLSTRR